ncbi:MAG: type II/IV secretion system protein [Gemmatimonadetes bacterium]|nr:type II/IV secretion system protein [Gemmatimonadota bacterium]MBK7785639.1 type II/IV secretion system protein [Gemmatimonadota bacterium]MBK9067230.1 type II/IV secretion system protein [Gemmatimonadota bacterium]
MRGTAGAPSGGGPHRQRSALPIQTALPVTEAFRPEYLSYYRILPLAVEAGVLRVAVAGAPNPGALDDLRQSYGLDLALEPVDDGELQDAIRRTFAAAESVVELVRDLDAALGPGEHDASEGLADVRDLANQPPVIRYVNLLIRDAHDARASDIHLEAAPDGLRVRLRIDGVLTELQGPPRGYQAAVVSRVKLLAELDIAERRAPQDGRIRVRLEARELDLRISTVPTLHGESVVLRLLDRGGQAVGLDDLGMAPDTLETFRRLATRPHGILLATGPTGSGKTTTLYAALALRDGGREKVVTVEDPVEYHLPGVTQVPVHSKAGVSFAAALRSILRQDPDVLMVGEMRDAETAGIAVQAAMTGHLVFSTLHTNDALSAIARLTDLRVEPYMVASTVEAVLAQRLVRRVCPECRARYRPDPAMVALLAQQPVGTITLERGTGCTACRHTGYRGRTGIFELLVLTDECKEAVSRGADAATLRGLARDQGMTSLRADGWRKVQAGMTTVEEVLRVAGE